MDLHSYLFMLLQYLVACSFFLKFFGFEVLAWSKRQKFFLWKKVDKLLAGATTPVKTSDFDLLPSVKVW